MNCSPPGSPVHGILQARILERVARRNSNNLRYADDTTLMAENKEELKSLLMRVKEESKNSTFRKLRSWYLVPSWKQWKC